MMKIKRPRVRQEIEVSLARSIASHEIEPGQKLPSEAELCSRFGVSRTALREAIKILEAKRMVRSKPRVGAIVLPREEWMLLDPDVLDWVADLLDADSFIDAVLEARWAIEPAAAALACRRASLADLALIEEALNDMADADGNADNFTEADLRFHEALLKASGNPVFVQFIHSVRAGLRLMLLASNKSVADYNNTVASHRALLETLITRDAEASVEASQRILQTARFDLNQKRHRP